MSFSYCKFCCPSRTSRHSPIPTAMALYRHHVLALTVFALCTAQILATSQPYSELIDCENCKGVIFGGPNPICGSDGLSYYNIEKLNCVSMCQPEPKVQFRHFGKCRGSRSVRQAWLPPGGSAAARCPCMKNIGSDRDLDPFCGSDGFTYYSQSEADCISSCYGHAIIRKHDGACQTFNQCNCQPSARIAYICGSDGQTYNNREDLDCNNICKKQRVVEKFKGKCGGLLAYDAISGR